MTPWERLYNVLIHVSLPAVVPAHYWAFRNRRPDRHTQARFVGNHSYMNQQSPRLWIHGASVGEMNLVETLRDWAIEGGVPPEQILITGQTLSGLNSLSHENTLLVPADYPALLGPLTSYAGPAPLIIVETEIWPNLYRLCQGELHLFNGHLKKKTFERYCRFKSLFRSTLNHCDSILARSEDEVRKFDVLTGGNEGTDIRSPGDLKWTKLFNEARDIPGSPGFKGDSTVLVAGSTWPGEEERVLKLVDQYDVAAYIAPRHMDRLDDVRALLDESGCSWRNWTASNERVQTDVILVDKIGVLADLYERGDIAFVGGSWAEGVGGHDLLEPARFGNPIWVGPHISNVRDTADRLKQAGLLTVLHGKSDWNREIKGYLETDATDLSENLGQIERYAQGIRDEYRSKLRLILEGTNHT